jgi:phage shock protein PspC (stress-responsive transcriptional regulator)
MKKGDKKMVENMYRSRTNKWLGGVAGGLGERFGIPALLVRLLFVLVALFPPIAMITVPIYLVLWLVVPQAPAEEAPAAEEVVVEAEAKSEA